MICFVFVKFSFCDFALNEILVFAELLALFLIISNLFMNLVKGKTSKKAKAEPTKEDVHAVIVDILKEVDFNTVSNYATLHWMIEVVSIL